MDEKSLMFDKIKDMYFEKKIDIEQLATAVEKGWIKPEEKDKIINEVL